MTGPPQPTTYLPALQSMQPYMLPPAAFENLISAYGIRIAWARAHSCACTFGGPIPGSPDPLCQTCGGRGVYWDQPLGPFQGLITLVHRGPTPDEPGSIMDENQGLIVNGEPTLTIPYNGAYAGQNTIWAEAGINDLFIEIDAISRFNAQLQVGVRTAVPYQSSLSIAPTGAVTVYDANNHVVVTGVSYTVSGVNVIVSGYPNGTNYICDFNAAPTFVGYRVAGMPAHVRPFGQLTLPRRFRLQTLDLWTRATGGSGDVPHV
jgi:hypothetical protein